MPPPSCSVLQPLCTRWSLLSLKSCFKGSWHHTPYVCAFASSRFQALGGKDLSINIYSVPSGVQRTCWQICSTMWLRLNYGAAFASVESLQVRALDAPSCSFLTKYSPGNNSPWFYTRMPNQLQKPLKPAHRQPHSLLLLSGMQHTGRTPAVEGKEQSEYNAGL